MDRCQFSLCFLLIISIDSTVTIPLSDDLELSLGEDNHTSLSSSFEKEDTHLQNTRILFANNQAVVSTNTTSQFEEHDSDKNITLAHDWTPPFNSADDDIPNSHNFSESKAGSNDPLNNDRENVALELEDTLLPNVKNTESRKTDELQDAILGKSTTDGQLILSNITIEKTVAGQLNKEADGAGLVNLNASIASTNNNKSSMDTKISSDEDTRPSVLELHPVLGDNRTIRFRSGHQEEWHQYTEDLAKFLEPYEKDAQEQNVHCDFERVNLHDDHACRFDLVYLGPSCTKQNNYGYGIGKPCVVISPVKIDNWIPVAYDNESTNVPDEVQRLMRIFNSNFMFVSCEGESEADRLNIGPMAYLPPYQGFPSYFFPHKGDTVSTYVAPLMAVEFLNPSNGTLINVVCHAWAKNVPDLPRQASIHFSIQVN